MTGQSLCWQLRFFSRGIAMPSTIDLSYRVARRSLVALMLWQHVGAADEPARIKDMQKERVAALQRVAELIDLSFKQGQVKVSERVKAYQKLFKAELESCDNNAERIKVREKMLSLAKADEEAVARLTRAGEADPTELPKAIARRLAIEIELERLKTQ
jgi:hypothetical protein